MAPDNLPESLQFVHKWWWDPIPWPLLQQLDKNILNQVVIAQLELQREVLGAQVKATEKVLGLLAKGR